LSDSFGKVVVLTGGGSAEREVSLKTAGSIKDALEKLGINHSLVDARDDFIPELIKEQPDLVFIAMHGGSGENGCMQGLLEILKIPYTGSGVLSSALCMDKIMCKKLFEYHGIKTPRWQEMNSASDLNIKLPVVIKPVSSGSAIATSIVKKNEQIQESYDAASREGEKVIAEKYIPGREVTVGIIDGEPLPVLEIFSKNSFYDYEAKYSRGMSVHREMEDSGGKLYSKIQEVAVRAYETAGCSHMGRVDFRVDGDDIYVLEINTIPGMTSTSLLPEAAGYAGIDFPELILRIIKSASEKT